MTDPDPRIPAAETELQPDPELRLSEGRASGLQITIVTLASLFILGLMIYGLGRPASDGSVIAAAPRAQETTGAAPPATPQDQPARQPAKAGVMEDDSKR